MSELAPAFKKYNEEQFTTVKLPGSSQLVSVTLAGKIVVSHLISESRFWSAPTIH
jgi:hypothetical protein